MTSDYSGSTCGTVLTGTASLANWDVTTTNTVQYYPWYPTPYVSPYVVTTYPADNTERVAALEGEVKVLREMLAALVGGGNECPTAKRPRTKGKRA